MVYRRSTGVFGNKEKIPFIISASILILSYVVFVLGYLGFCIILLLIGLIGSLISQRIEKGYLLHESALAFLRDYFKKIGSEIVSGIKILKYAGLLSLPLFCLFAVKSQIITEISLVLVPLCLIFVITTIYEIYKKAVNNIEFALTLLNSFACAIILIAPFLFARSLFYTAAALLPILGCFAIAWKGFEKRKFSLALKEASRISSSIIIVALIFGLITGVPPVAQNKPWLDSTEHALKSYVFLEKASGKVWNGYYDDAYPLLETAKEECKYSEKSFREFNKIAWRKNNVYSEQNYFITGSLNVLIDYFNESAKMFEIMKEIEGQIGINTSKAIIYKRELTNQKNELDETLKNMESVLDRAPFYLQPFIKAMGLKEKIESESKGVSYLYERKMEDLRRIQAQNEES